MKAYVLHGIADFRYEEVERPKAEPGEVLVRVMAAGICGSDIPRIYRTGAYHHPLIPGHEFSGQVDEVAEGVSKEWQGKRVGIFPLIPCMKCSSCLKKKYEMCSHYNYLGSRTDGGFAEFVRVPEWNLIELPENVSFEQAAMLEPMAVAVHAIRQSGLLDREGKLRDDVCRKKIAIFGLGTIGLFINMFLKSLGCEKVYVAGNKDFQQRMAEKLGISASNYCDVRKIDPVEWINEKTKGEGVDFLYECVGKNEVLTQGLSCIAPGGTLLLVGNPATDMTLEKTVYWKILRRQITVQGTWNSAFTKEEYDDWHFVLNLLQKELIHPEEMITHKLSESDMMGGFELMRDKSEDYVKVMVFFTKIMG